MRDNNFKKIILIFLKLLILVNECYSDALKVALYDDVDHRGEKFELRFLNCTNLPPEWHDRTSSVDIFNSVCLKLFEHSDCQGRYVALKAAYHSDSDYLYNLKELNFNDVISSVSPCSLQIEPGQYVLQNLADNKMMTLVEEHSFYRLYSTFWRDIRPQHWDVSNVVGSSSLYEIKPVGVPYSLNKPVIFDINELKDIQRKRHVKPTFRIESVGDWKYIIADTRTDKCLATRRKGEILPEACLYTAKRQQWIFRKVR